MPPVDIIFFKDDDGTAPVLEWIKHLSKGEKAKVISHIQLLAEKGHELRRPHADSVCGSDLYELRLRFGRLRVRILYFFFMRYAAVLDHVVHGKKTDAIPQAEINRALKKRDQFIQDPEKHTIKNEVLS